MERFLAPKLCVHHVLLCRLIKVLVNWYVYKKKLPNINLYSCISNCTILVPASEYDI